MRSGSSGTAPSGRRTGRRSRSRVCREALAGLDDGALAVVGCLTLWVANLLERGDSEEDPRGGRRRGGGCALAPPGRRRHERGRARDRPGDAERSVRIATCSDGSTRRSSSTPTGPRSSSPGGFCHWIRLPRWGIGHGRRAEPDDRANRSARRGRHAGGRAGARPKDEAEGQPRAARAAAQYAGIRGDAAPPPLVPAVLVAAADHGYAEDGVARTRR